MQKRRLIFCSIIFLVASLSFAAGYLANRESAAHSPIMPAVRAFAEAGGHVLGVCNGFQILTEAGLLPGALLRNAGLRFLRLRATHSSTTA